MENCQLLSPIISNIEVKAVTSDQAIITWTTDQNASNEVNYGLSPDYNFAVRSPEEVTQHSITLTDLLPSTLYFFIVRSENSNHQETKSDNHTFKTQTYSHSQVQLDGNPTKWDDINPIATCINGNARELKVYNDSTDLYCCVEGDYLTLITTSEFLINTDNDPSTGWQDQRLWNQSGCKAIAENNKLYEYCGVEKTPCWKYLQSISYITTPHCIKAKIPLKSLSLTPGKIITVGYLGMDASLNKIAQLPTQGNLPPYNVI